MDASLFCFAGMVCLEAFGVNYQFAGNSLFRRRTICIFSSYADEGWSLDILGKPLSYFGSPIFKFSANAAQANFVLDFASGDILAHPFLFISNGIGTLACKFFGCLVSSQRNLIHRLHCWISKCFANVDILHVAGGLFFSRFRLGRCLGLWRL